MGKKVYVLCETSQTGIGEDTDYYIEAVNKNDENFDDLTNPDRPYLFGVYETRREAVVEAAQVSIENIIDILEDGEIEYALEKLKFLVNFLEKEKKNLR